MKVHKIYSICATLALLICLLSIGEAQQSSVVSIRNFSFQPNMLSVQAGTTVIWINNDSTSHTVTSDNGIFDSGPILPNGQFKYAFIQLGNFSYHCKIHPAMKGEIQVKSVSVPMPAVITFNPLSNASYDQYYSMNTGTPSAHISMPQLVGIKDIMPNMVYFGNQMQPVPFSQYQSSPTYLEGNSLWIKGTTDWTQYASVPVGANVPLLAISSAGGSGNLNLVDANGQVYNYDYFFYPNSQLTFYGDIPGRHILSYSIEGVTSNPVVIDVTGTVTMTYNPGNLSNYYPPIGTYPGYYNLYNNSTNPQAALDLADFNKAYQKMLMSGYYIPEIYANYNDSNDWTYGAYAWLNAPS